MCVGRFWLFDFCEALARVMGKRQCAKCVSASLFCLSWGGKKLNLLSFLSVIFSIQYFVIKLIFPCQVCSPLVFFALLLTFCCLPQWEGIEALLFQVTTTFDTCCADLMRTAPSINYTACCALYLLFYVFHFQSFYQDSSTQKMLYDLILKSLFL